MKAAFLLVVSLPPPAPRAFGLSYADRARAGGAADRRKAAIVQHVVGNFVERHVVGEVAAAPFRKRIDLDEPERCVEFRKQRAAAVLGLLGPQTRDPGNRAGECPPQRLDLADAAAGLADLDGVAEA